MTITNHSAPPAYCQRLEQYGLRELLAIGEDGAGLQPTAAEALLGITAGSIARQALCLALRGFVELPFSLDTSTNDSQAYDLEVLLGAVTEVGYMREVAAKIYVRSTTTLAAVKFARAIVIGAATDVVNVQAHIPTGPLNNIREFGNGTAFTDPTYTFAASGASSTFTIVGDAGVNVRHSGVLQIYPKIFLPLTA